MERNSHIYSTYVQILKRELVPAMGCTEPIAVAYCAARAREALGSLPERVEIHASGNIIKNVKSVIVPHSNHMRGLEAAAALGIFYGDAEAELEVVSGVSAAQSMRLCEDMKSASFEVVPLVSDHVLDLRIALFKGEDSASVRICDEHTNIVEIIKNGEVVFRKDDRPRQTDGEALPDYSLLRIADIFDFANSADLSDVKEMLERQIEYNGAISEEGLKKDYGARIGKLLLLQDRNVRTLARAAAAAGSDARMSGCDMPVIINSGSGNQGMTTSLPVLVYGRYYKKSDEEIYRALLISNLVTLRLKNGIGRLSAYCGAVSAGAGAGAGIAYLITGELRTVNHTIVNALAISSGIVCDGAKASCAAKIAMAVDAGIMGYEMYREGCQFYGGDGLVSKGVENTIDNISSLGHDGMKETDLKIIEIMTKSC